MGPRRNILALTALFACLLLAFGCSDSEDCPVCPNPTAPLDTLPTEPTGFDWPETTPAAVGLDSLTLETAHNAMRDAVYPHSFLVVRRDSLVFERYYHNYDAETTHNLYSVTKSVMSCLAGLAIEDGIFTGLDDRFFDTFGEYDQPEYDPYMEQITIGHLLSNLSGFGDDGQTFYEVVYTDDWIRAFLDTPLLTVPGTTFAYNTTGFHHRNVRPRITLPTACSDPWASTSTSGRRTPWATPGAATTFA